jgi:hypothetical protein
MLVERLTKRVIMKAIIDASKKKAKALVAGFVSYDDLCRFAVHNLSERKNILQEIGGDISAVRKHYLEDQLKGLNIERSYIVKKEQRIRANATSEHLFII